MQQECPELRQGSYSPGNKKDQEVADNRLSKIVSETTPGIAQLRFGNEKEDFLMGVHSDRNPVQGFQAADMQRYVQSKEIGL